LGTIQEQLTLRSSVTRVVLRTLQLGLLSAIQSESGLLIYTFDLSMMTTAQPGGLLSTLHAIVVQKRPYTEFLLTGAANVDKPS